MLDKFGKDTCTLKKKKLFLFDQDGTIYLENDLFDGVLELLDTIEESGGKYVFITNNSSKSVDAYLGKVRKMGIKADESNFFTSTQAAELIFKERFGNGKIYAQGTRSFIKDLTENGLNVTEEYDENVKAILVGYDTELTYEKMRTTCKLLTNTNVPYYATNPDWVCPTDFGYAPDCGSMCEGYFRATGKRPVFIGKPEPAMIFEVMKKFGVKREDAVVVGDRIYTDIASGINAGVDTVCVLSGEVTLDEVIREQRKATFTLDSVKDILTTLSEK